MSTPVTVRFLVDDHVRIRDQGAAGADPDVEQSAGGWQPIEDSAVPCPRQRHDRRIVDEPPRSADDVHIVQGDRTC